MDIGILIFAVLGAISGSFAGVIAERANTGQSWVGGRSRCNACAITLTALDMVPMLSWLASAGKCRSCGASVSAAYLLLEFALAVSFGAAYWMFGLTLALIPFLFALIVLAALIAYDIRHMIVPSIFSNALIVLSLIYAMLAYAPHELGLVLMLSGGVALVLYLFHALSNGRLMGLGDAPVALALSLLAGTQAIAGFLFSFWIGAAVGILLLLMRRGNSTMNTEVPFVPFLAAGFLLALFTQWNPLFLIAF